MEQIESKIPYKFIASRTALTWQEVKFGIEKNIFHPAESIQLAAKLLISGDDDDSLIELASKAPDEPIMGELSKLAKKESKQSIHQIRRKWAFLLLSWVFEHRHRYADPLELAERVYADLDHPEQVAPLVRYMPSNGATSNDTAANEAKLMENWGEYLRSEGEEFSVRRL